jgi:LmbE family N-acetylglucosaminyl deacetylase
MDTLIINNPVPFQSLEIARSLRVLVLAPHPDDLDAIGVTARFLLENGNPLYVVVATSGASGVEDLFCSPPTAEAKAQLREQEQQASCQFLGLAGTNLIFLRLKEDDTGQPAGEEANIKSVRQQLQTRRPTMVFLPHGHDTNLGHQRVYTMFRQVAWEAGFPLVAFFNRDPKTIQMQCDVYHGYDEIMATWKGELLRFHRSQHQRNLNQRGYGFDDRILRMDQNSAEVCFTGTPYAEVFEIELFGANRFQDILRP